MKTIARCAFTILAVMPVTGMSGSDSFPDVITPDERAWIAGNVPLLQCPDPVLQEVYYFRWAIYRRHLRETKDGWVVSEFIQPGPGGKHGTINAAAGHHIYEGRWLRNPRFLDDYSRFWFTDPEAKPHLYAEWIADAIWARACVTGDFQLPQELLPGLVRNYAAWENSSRHPNGLYWSHDLADAMEFSISGDGFRPTVNVYQFGNARAIARIADLAGDRALAEEYTRKAEELRRLVQTRLWDDEARFFKVYPLSDSSIESYLKTKGKTRRLPDRERATVISDWNFRKIAPERNVREAMGYIPWYFGLPGTDKKMNEAWSQIMDPAGFWGFYGPTTAERRHPGFRIETITKASVGACQWNGPSWPFATSQTLTALANFLRNYPAQEIISNADYFQTLRAYAASHSVHSPGEPPRLFIHENLNPDTGEWIVYEYRKRNEPHRIQIGQDYNHSTFNDLVISGLLGIEPTSDGLLGIRPLLPAGVWPWFEIRRLRLWNHDVDVRYDRTGEHFGLGRGLAVWVDGVEVARRPDLGSLSIALKP